MSTQTLRSIATDVVGQYGQVGKLIVGAYRTGAQRIVKGANTRYVSFLNQRSLPLVSDNIKASLINMQNKIAGAVHNGITTGTERAEQAIDLVAGGFSGGIERVAATAGRVESALNTNALSTVGSLSIPVAQVSLDIANRAVAGTRRLSTRVNGAEPQVVRAKVVDAKTTAKRVVKRVAKTAARTSAKTSAKTAAKKVSVRAKARG